MHEQLEAIVGEFEQATLRLHRLAASMTSERWLRRSEPNRWSAAECIAHLNLTTVAFRPLVEKALAEARRLQAAREEPEPRRRYRRGLIGGLLWWVLGKRGRFRTKTAPAFVPGDAAPVETVIAEFERLQDEQIGWVRAADGLPLRDVRVASPFNPRVRYNLFAALSILARHQQRHVSQAEDAARASFSLSR